MSDSSDKNIPFIDLKAQRDRIAPEIGDAIAAVIDHAAFISGPEILELEVQLAGRGGCTEVVACASGTDALVLALNALGIGPGDVVFVPSFTFVATVEAVALVGAIPFFCDVAGTDFNLCPSSVERAISECERNSIGSPRAIIPVDLFGQPADYTPLQALAECHNLMILADAAQSFGAIYHDTAVGGMAPLTTTSFFPAKPLGCYGDGGAVFDRDGRFAAKMRSLREHGFEKEKYKYAHVGYNARMDTIQAAVLIEKLKIFDDELRARSRIAANYSERLDGVVATPRIAVGRTSSWAQYTIRSPDRDELSRNLKAKGIPTAVYYPQPVHVQGPYREFPFVANGLPVTKDLTKTVLSLPMHAYLSEEDQSRICDAVVECIGAGG